MGNGKGEANGEQERSGKEKGKKEEKIKQKSDKLKRSLAWLSVSWSPPKRLAPVQGVHKPSVSLTAITVPHYGWLTEINLLNAASNREGGQPSLARGSSHVSAALGVWQERVRFLPSTSSPGTETTQCPQCPQGTRQWGGQD